MLYEIWDLRYVGEVIHQLAEEKENTLVSLRYHPWHVEPGGFYRLVHPLPSFVCVKHLHLGMLK